MIRPGGWSLILGAWILVLITSYSCTALVFTNSFYVRLRGDGGQEAASLVAKRTGFDNFGPVSIQYLLHIYLHVQRDFHIC